MTSKNFDIPKNWDFNRFKTSSGADIRYGSAEPDGPSKGTVVLTGGYGRHIEYYYETINNWLDRGYTVYAMDWDGQGGSGRADPDHPRKPPTVDFDHHVQTFHEFVNSIVKPAPDKPAFLSSHSMGGNIMLRYLHKHENDADFPFQAAILGTPLIDLQHYGMTRRFFTNMINTLNKAGLGDMPLPSLPKMLIDFYDAATGRGSTKRDHEREDIHEQYKNDTNEFEIGFPTIGWLRAAFQSCDVLRRDHVLESIQTPVLILTSQTDTLVSIKAQYHAAAALPNGQQKTYEHARHGIWYDIDEIQQEMWQDIDIFIKHLRRGFDKGWLLGIFSHPQQNLKP